MRKIYIKTEMKELPKRCVECELRESKTQICTATGEKTSYDNRQMMCPAWCPLVELKGEIKMSTTQKACVSGTN